MQFLENHKMMYLKLHREFSKLEYSSQSEASLQSFKTPNARNKLVDGLRYGLGDSYCHNAAHDGADQAHVQLEAALLSAAAQGEGTDASVVNSEEENRDGGGGVAPAAAAHPTGGAPDDRAPAASAGDDGGILQGAEV